MEFHRNRNKTETKTFYRTETETETQNQNYCLVNKYIVAKANHNKFNEYFVNRFVMI